jgi:hypothetical protein
MSKVVEVGGMSKVVEVGSGSVNQHSYEQKTKSKGMESCRQRMDQ